METFTVIPCFNEQDCLAATCTSLGFGLDMQQVGRLVLVDNGSTDGTRAVMSEVQRALPAGRVLIVKEPQRGYVPARRAGMMAILDRTRVDCITPEATLVLQADADTLYLPGYVQAMVAACSGARGQFLEGSALTSREFNSQFPAFIQLCREVDEGMGDWFAPEAQQVVVDDKVCAFLLADYFAWGGHQDELDGCGQPVFAETTRLYMRARHQGGAWRESVQGAGALPSRRKLLTQAMGYFACSGFPRQTSWMRAWGAASEAEAFMVAPRGWPKLQRLVRSRQRHQLALFGLLPALNNDRSGIQPGVAAMADALQKTTEAMSPGGILGLLLKLADEEAGALSAILGHR